MNLLDNANKYTDHEGLITVTLQKEGKEAVLRVSDNGLGIAPDVLPHIFELFMQADQSLHRAQGGLGIGLALVQLLVTMHKGRVEARSALGRGASSSSDSRALLCLTSDSVDRNESVRSPSWCTQSAGRRGQP